MYRRVAAACLIVVVADVLVACSSDGTSGEDAGGAGSDAGGDPDAASPDADVASDAAAPGDAAIADAAPLPDAASPRDAEPQDCGRIQCDCTFQDIPLFGRVQYVDSFPDITVRETPFPDLRVREGSFADSCGEWEIVESFPDFTVQVVTSFEDFGIEYSAFPGIP